VAWRTSHSYPLKCRVEDHVALANAELRVLDEDGVRAPDLSPLSGVSKEAIRMAMGILLKRRFVVVKPEPNGGRAKVARLTPVGRAAQVAYHQLLLVMEERWKARFGEETISNLRQLLERLAGEPDAPASPPLAGLEPYPDGWRVGQQARHSTALSDAAASRRYPRREPKDGTEFLQ
jgi:DNA-binding MarR family transcriptional regulator